LKQSPTLREKTFPFIEHPEATNRSARATAYFLIAPVCHPSLKGGRGDTGAFGVDACGASDGASCGRVGRRSQVRVTPHPEGARSANSVHHNDFVVISVDLTYKGKEA
jgi:hypothetical protein